MYPSNTKRENMCPANHSQRYKQCSSLCSHSGGGQAMLSLSPYPAL